MIARLYNLHFSKGEYAKSQLVLHHSVVVDDESVPASVTEDTDGPAGAAEGAVSLAGFGVGGDAGVVDADDGAAAAAAGPGVVLAPASCQAGNPGGRPTMCDKGDERGSWFCPSAFADDDEDDGRVGCGEEADAKGDDDGLEKVCGE
jgi:hypothetical protein